MNLRNHHGQMSESLLTASFIILSGGLQDAYTYQMCIRDRYTDITELTPELLRLFIEKIVVHEKEVKWSKHAPQTVEIYYNGIGYVGSGQQDVEEALEAPESLQTQDTEKPRQAS